MGGGPGTGLDESEGPKIPSDVTYDRLEGCRPHAPRRNGIRSSNSGGGGEGGEYGRSIGLGGSNRLALGKGGTGITGLVSSTGERGGLVVLLGTVDRSPSGCVLCEFRRREANSLKSDTRLRTARRIDS